MKFASINTYIYIYTYVYICIYRSQLHCQCLSSSTLPEIHPILIRMLCQARCFQKWMHLFCATNVVSFHFDLLHDLLFLEKSHHRLLQWFEVLDCTNNLGVCKFHTWSSKELSLIVCKSYRLCSQSAIVTLLDLRSSLVDWPQQSPPPKKGKLNNKSWARCHLQPKPQWLTNKANTDGTVSLLFEQHCLILLHIDIDKIKPKHEYRLISLFLPAKPFPSHRCKKQIPRKVKKTVQQDCIKNYPSKNI